MMTTLTSYLLSGGTRQARELFRDPALEEELILTTVKDTAARRQRPESQYQKILNGRLRGSNVSISASDWLGADRTLVRGNTACRYLRGDTLNELKSWYEKFSYEGTP